ncbi:hypothetical protein UFOVP239_13 [uncultured Caudovirales phage]|uniref:Uncharacterized protein n=1 Tax=uncultured Caudovirales phage TaxID=2100421 RepID=A0A6J7WPM4_9CAUD|nr:hypothetical protein UFOVP239_13 [uncultured Caudovirales phage]
MSDSEPSPMYQEQFYRPEPHVVVMCAKHGEHDHAIVSGIPGHEGMWCQLCWLESLGPSLPYKKTW